MATQPEDGLPLQLTSYVGRDSDIASATGQLATSRLVTFVGPGGVGKTRLALQLGALLQDQYADGVLFVPLAEISDGDLMTATIAEQLGLADRQAGQAADVVVAALRARHLLLVLDNCEHLLGACAAFAVAVVQQCPDVAILCTSRQSLGVAGEGIQPVGPLAVPPADARAAEIADYDAVRLFVDRARAVVPSFRLTEDNAAAMVRLSRQLEGLPLAIELAAIRVRALSVGQIADRLDEQLGLLTGDSRTLGPNHHGTLRALIDWSHDRCSPGERTLWERVSVFVGTFDLDAVEEVGSGGGIEPSDVLGLVDGLLNKSILLREERKGVVRYRMLEPMRQYGHDRLRDSGELAAVRRRHRDWYAALADAFETEWLSDQQVTWSDRLHLEHANLRAAIEFCATDADEAEAGLTMAWRIKEFFLVRGLNTEGRVHLSKLLAAAAPDAKARERALWMYAFLARIQNDMAAYRSSLADLDRSEDDVVRAHVHLLRGYDALIGDRMHEASDEFEKATAAFADQGVLAAELWARYNLGIAVALAGDLGRGRAILRDAIAAYAERGEIFWRTWALWSLGAAEMLAGDLEKARDAVRQVLELEQMVRDRVVIAFALTVASGIATRSGDDRRAAKTFGAAAAAWQSIGASLNDYEAFAHHMQAGTDQATARLGVEVAAAEFTAGMAMGAREAIDYALSDAPDAAETDEGLDVLTPREREVAGLLAKGMTNQEIAHDLVISRRTAETHVNNILNRLGFSSRAQVAAWMVRHGDDA